MYLKTHLRSGSVFFLLFILFTIIGTISHEYGHIVVAKILGYKTELHYSSMTYNRAQKRNNINKIIARNEYQIQSHLDYPEKENLEKLIKNFRKDSLLISLGGPFQTILTGTIGFIALLLRWKSVKKNGLKIIDWFYVFLSLFWLRQTSNLALWLIKVFVFNVQKHYRSDEFKIAQMLGIHFATISVITGILGLTIALVVIFKIIDKSNRLPFIAGGFLGGICGFIFWMKIIGPILLP